MILTKTNSTLSENSYEVTKNVGFFVHCSFCPEGVSCNYSYKNAEVQEKV